REVSPGRRHPPSSRLEKRPRSPRMVATLNGPRSVLRFVRRPLLLAPIAVVLVGAGACWWFTESLEPASSASLARTVAKPEVAKPARKPLEWPEDRLDGEPAKRLLLDVLLAGRERLNAASGYTATFRKQERINGKFGPEQTMLMKVRHQPFSIY